MGKIRDNIAENLSFYLKERNITQKELATKLGVVQSAVTNWIKKDNAPDIEMVAKICDVLQITLNDLYGINNSDYSEIEKRIIHQYRNNPEIQGAVKILLGIKK